MTSISDIPDFFVADLHQIGLVIYTPCLKKTVQAYLLSELCQISTDCENFWHRDSKENKLF